MSGEREWIIVRDRTEEIGDVYATGRRLALEKLRELWGGSRDGTGGFTEVLRESRLGGSITVWRRAELQDPRLFDRPPRPSKVRMTLRAPEAVATERGTDD